MNDSDPELGPFATLYEKWFREPRGRRDARVAERLAASYRDAWRNNVGVDRVYVFYFLFQQEDHTGADLILEGLHDTDRKVA